MTPLKISREWMSLFLVAGAVLTVAFACAGSAWAQDAAAAPAEQAAPADQAAAPEPAAEPAKEAPPAEEAPAKDWIRGRFTAGLDAAFADGDSDFDLNQTLNLKIDPPSCDKVHIRGLLWMNEDLGTSNASTSALRDINDAYGPDIRARLLQLYVDIDDLAGDSTLRIGRQRIEESPAFNRIDGAYFTQRLGQWSWYAFAGSRASVYEESFTDYTFGAGASYRPAPRTKLSLDAYYGVENRPESSEVYPGLLPRLLGLSYPRRVEDRVDDGMLAFTFWQGITENLNLYGRYILNDAQGDEAYLDLTGFVPSWELTYELAYRSQLNSVGDRVSDITSFYRTMGVYEQYDDLLATVSKMLTERFAVTLEAELHNSEHSSWETSNRDYTRYAVTLSAAPLVEKVDASVSFEYWDVDAGESTTAWTGEITRKWNCFALTLGADYAKYVDRITEYNPSYDSMRAMVGWLIPQLPQGFTPVVYIFDDYAVTTHEDVYSIFGKGIWNIKENQDLSARISYEEDDGPYSPYWRVQCDYSIRF